MASAAGASPPCMHETNARRTSGGPCSAPSSLCEAMHGTGESTALLEQWQAHVELRQKLQSLLVAITQHFYVQNISLLQVWVNACTSTMKDSHHMRLFPDPNLLLMGDSGLASFRAASCTSLQDARTGMPGHAWRTGCVQVVQNLRIIPEGLHPRSRLTDPCLLDRLAEVLYVPVYDAHRPSAGPVAVLEALLSGRSTDSMLVANLLSFVGSSLSALQLSLSNPIPQPIRRSTMAGRRARAVRAGGSGADGSSGSDESEVGSDSDDSDSPARAAGVPKQPGTRASARQQLPPPMGAGAAAARSLAKAALEEACVAVPASSRTAAAPTAAVSVTVVAAVTAAPEASAKPPSAALASCATSKPKSTPADSAASTGTACAPRAVACVLASMLPPLAMNEPLQAASAAAAPSVPALSSSAAPACPASSSSAAAAAADDCAASRAAAPPALAPPASGRRMRRPASRTATASPSKRPATAPAAIAAAPPSSPAAASGRGEGGRPVKLRRTLSFQRTRSSTDLGAAGAAPPLPPTPTAAAASAAHSANSAAACSAAADGQLPSPVAERYGGCPAAALHPAGSC